MTSVTTEWSCSICGQKFDSEEAVKAHAEKCHSDYNLQVVICQDLEVKYRITLEGPHEDISEAFGRISKMSEFTPGELVKVFMKAEKWNNLINTMKEDLEAKP